MFKIIKTNKYDPIVERALYYAYFVYQFMFLLHVTYLAHNVESFGLLTSIFIICSFGVILLCDVYYFFRGKYDLNEILIYAIVGIFLLISLYNYRDVMVMVNLFAIMAFKNVDAKKVLKIYLIATTIGMAIAFTLGAFTPYTSNIIRKVVNGTRIRYGLGFYYTTMAPHYFFSLVLVFLIVCKKIKLIYYIAIVSINAILFILTDTKAPFAYVLLIVLIHFVLERTKIDVVLNIFGFLTVLSYPFCTLLSYFTAVFYSDKNKLLYYFDKILTGRLRLTHNAIEKCGFQIFGQTIDVWGQGFYIDSSIINMLVLNGVVVLIISVVFMTIFSYMSAKNKDIPIMIALSFFAIRSAFDWGFMALQMTPVVIMFYNVYERYKLIKGEDNVKTN